MARVETLQGQPSAWIESVVRSLHPSSKDDARSLLQFIVRNLTALSPGGNLIQPGGAPVGSSKPPVGISHTATGANGVVTIAITNPPIPPTTQIWHEISYSPVKSFTQGITTLEPTTSTAVSVPSPGLNAFFRRRSSFDKKTWSPYELVSTSAISAGLVESSAVSAGGSFNQTNFAVVNSQAASGAAEVFISGTGGVLSSYTAVRGEAETVRPSATIIGVQPQSEQFVGWDGTQFRLKPTLAGVLSDHLEPVGKVSVVSTATPSLPVIHAVVAGGGVVGYNVISGGSGASQPYTITITDGPGTGATAGAQTIVGGVLIAITPGNPGINYDGSTVVTASGGGPGGIGGGGTAVGGNGGRMSNV